MNVEDLFRRLSYGELSNLSMSGNGSGTIASGSQGKIITAANDGLLRLYSKFVLREKDLIIEQVEGITNYHLLKRFTESECEPECGDTPYIKDGVDPFEEDVIRILQVFDQTGCELPLNDQNRLNSLFTPQPTMLQVPAPVEGQMLSIIYQARHVPLPHGILGTDIDLPAVLEPALTAYIGGRIYSGMNGAENTAKGQEYMALYERVCVDVVQQDLVGNSRVSSNSKFDMRGFV